MWLTLNTHNRQADGAMLTQPVPEEKYIVMPTDYAEPMVGLLLFFKQTAAPNQNLKRVVFPDYVSLRGS